MPRGRGAAKRWRQKARQKIEAYEAQVAKWGAPQDFPEDDPWHPGHRIGVQSFMKQQQEKYNISDEVMDFMYKNEDVYDVLLHYKFNIQDAVDNWDQDYDYMMLLFGGSQEKVDAVHNKLKEWLSKRASNSTNGTNSLLNPYIVRLD